VHKTRLEDTKMKMPGFTAEASLYETKRHSAALSPPRIVTAVYPAQLTFDRPGLSEVQVFRDGYCPPGWSGMYVYRWQENCVEEHPPCKLINAKTGEEFCPPPRITCSPGYVRRWVCTRAS
jgi:hypothetical protein